MLWRAMASALLKASSCCVSRDHMMWCMYDSRESHRPPTTTLVKSIAMRIPCAPKLSLSSGAAKRGGYKRQGGGISRSGLVLPFLSFLGLSRFFRVFPDLLGDGPGIFPMRPFPLSRPKEHLRGTAPKGSATQSGPFPKHSGRPPGLETPRFSFSQLFSFQLNRSTCSGAGLAAATA